MSEIPFNITSLCNRGQDTLQCLLESTVELMKECGNMQVSEKTEERFKNKIEQVNKNKNLLIKIIKEVDSNKPQNVLLSQLSLYDVPIKEKSLRVIEQEKLLEKKFNRLKELRNQLRDLQYLLNSGADVNAFMNSKDPTNQAVFQ